MMMKFLNLLWMILKVLISTIIVCLLTPATVQGWF